MLLIKDKEITEILKKKARNKLNISEIQAERN